ncbi:MAG: transglutaminase family protein [Bacteroidia bacterium]|nr:transglutaminase family protein [Bacteroidia bacterium]
MDTKPADLKALIQLLEDDDAAIFELVSDKIRTLGKSIIPDLEDAWSKSFHPILQQRIEELIHEIHINNLVDELKLWSVLQQHDIIAGALIVAKHQYPDLNETDVYATLNKLKRSIWLELNEDLTSLEKVNVMNQVLFDTYLFKGNTGNYHAPANSYLHLVLENKKGNPLLLSVIYMYLAQQLDMPVYGVNLPEHFVLAYMDESDILKEAINDHETKALFYINPFSRGNIFNRNEIDDFLGKLKMPVQPAYYEPCSNLDIIKRMIRNLIFSYHKSGNTEKVAELEKMLACL